MTALLGSSGGGEGLFLAILIATVICVIAIAASSARSQQLRDCLKRLAQRLGGQVGEGGFAGEPMLQFTLAGRSARLEFFAGSKNSRPYSRVTVGLGGRSPGTLHIVREGFAQSFLKMFGAQDIEIGEPRFDSEFVLKANPASLVPQLFSPARREKVMRSARNLWSFEDASLDLDRSQLTVQAREFIIDDARLMLLVGTAEEFLGYLFGATAPAAGDDIQWVEEKVLSGGECPVCGTSMQERVVRCEACRTPHHSECWSYMGRCSTYACTGKRSVA